MLMCSEERRDSCTQIISGTHAISIALFGVLRPGDELLYITGKPYDTLEEIVGVRGGEYSGSLKEFQIGYNAVDLTSEGRVDFEAVRAAIPNTKVIGIQRSKGYANRPSFRINEIEEMIRFVKEIKEDVIVLWTIATENLQKSGNPATSERILWLLIKTRAALKRAAIL